MSNFGCLEEFTALKIANPKMQLVMHKQYFINCDMFSHQIHLPNFSVSWVIAATSKDKCNFARFPCGYLHFIKSFLKKSAYVFFFLMTYII